MAECAVIAAPDEARGPIVLAHVVHSIGHVPSGALIKLLQNHVKSSITAFKYPRSVIFSKALPKTEIGKFSVLA